MIKLFWLGGVLFLSLVCTQANTRGNGLVSDSLVKKSWEIFGEYSPAPYQSIQDPLDGGRNDHEDNTIIRTEKDREWDMTTYFLPLKKVGENLVLIYLCTTTHEGEKSSWIQLFERSDKGDLVSYSSGSELTKQVLKITHQGFQKIEYTLGPKIAFEDGESFFEQMEELIQHHKVPDLALSYNMRSRTFLATHTPYPLPPTDNEFNWKTWESQVKKYEQDLIDGFKAEQLVFETLARQLQFPQAFPAENIFWVLDRIERINRCPFQKEQIPVSAISRKMDDQYRKNMQQKRGGASDLFMETTRETQSFDTGVVTRETRIIVDGSAGNRVIQDLITITHHLSWKMPAQVIAQAGGNLTFSLFAFREVSSPKKALLIPSPLPDFEASVRYTSRDAKGREREGGKVHAVLLDHYPTTGPGKGARKVELTLPLESFFSEAAEITLNCNPGTNAGIRSWGGVGLKLYYKRKIMTPDEATALGEILGEKIKIQDQRIESDPA